jgi:hypothetical protein
MFSHFKAGFYEWDAAEFYQDTTIRGSLTEAVTQGLLAVDVTQFDKPALVY